MSDVKTETLKKKILNSKLDRASLHHFSHETIGAQLLIGRARGERVQVAFLRTSPEVGLNRNYVNDDKLQRRNSVVQILKHETSIDVRLHDFSRETFDTQFLIDRAWRGGGQLA